MDILSLIVGIVSLVVAGVSIWVAVYSMQSQKKSSLKIERSLSRIKSLIAESTSDENK